MTQVALTPRQQQAFNTDATEVLYGGAAGGGKSYLLRVSSIRWAMSVPGCQIYLFRRSFTDLRDNHLRGPTSYHELLGDFISSKHVKWSAQDFEFTFWNGSRIKLAHAQFEDDILKYQGAEIHVLMIDELTHFTETMYRFLRGRVRAVGLKVPEEFEGRIPRIECGSNPGSVGHAWVKRTWINFAAPFRVKRAPNEEGGMLRQYIPAQLEDNPYLMDEDPLYESRLEGLGTPELVRAMRHGDWDIVAGQAFEQLTRATHAVEPFEIPEHWTKFGAIDWGSSKPFCAQWWAVSDGTIGDIPKDALVLFREWYGWTGQPDVGLRLSSDAVAEGILERTVEPMDYWVGDPAMFNKHDGPSISERMGDQGLYLIPADNNRILGYMEVRDRVAGDKRPMLYAFSTCVDGFWRTLPDLVIDDRKLSGSGKEDVNTQQEDHAYDTCRYACMSRPWARSRREKQLQRDRWESAFKFREREDSSWKTV